MNSFSNICVYGISARLKGKGNVMHLESNFFLNLRVNRKYDKS